MNWLKVKINYYSKNLEITKNKIINILLEVGINQYELVDQFTENELDYNTKNYDNDIWAIIGYVVDNKFADIKLNIISEQLENMQDEDFLYELFIVKCSDTEWKDEWKKHFNTTKITNNIIVKPSWRTYNKTDENEILIEIDPGMAFGTGTHETTSLCVELMETNISNMFINNNSNNMSMLDIGCGSGILMLVAKKLGIKYIHGIDIDKNVENVVVENLNKNNIFNDYKIIIGNLVDDVNEKYDLVVSNILVDVLIKLLPNINKILNENGIVIFSGIINDKIDTFIEHAAKYGLTKKDTLTKGNWSAVSFEYKQTDNLKDDEI